MSHKVGYARTSTSEQKDGLAAQEKALKEAGCDEIFSEHASAKSGNPRPKLEEAIKYLRKGDVLLVVRLDRLARSMDDLRKIANRVKERGAALKVLDCPIIDTSADNPTGELVMSILGAIAQFELGLQKARRAEAREIRQAKGLGFGRPATARDKAADVIAMLGEGKTPKDVATTLGISEASVWRIKRAAKGSSGKAA